jgi:aminoglycoside phosphotransferase
MNLDGFVRRCVPGAERVTSRRSAFATSHRLDEVDLRCADGAVIPLILKRSGPHDLLPEAEGMRPDFLVDHQREAFVYSAILARSSLDTPRFFGSRDDPRGGSWLLIERVPGAQLCHVGDRTLWERSARWLARMHVELSRFVGSPAATRLVHHDANFYHRWRARAIALHPDARERIIRSTRRWDEVVDRLVATPKTIVHGELYASNVLVDARAATARVCAIDWEMTSVAPAMVDLAALTSGWDDDVRRALVRAYHNELVAHGGEPALDELESVLADCRLYLCLQWLGWARGWVPPDDQTNDWLGEALRLADARAS